MPNKSMVLTVTLLILISQMRGSISTGSPLGDQEINTSTQEWITLGKNAQRHFSTSEYISPPLQERWQINFPQGIPRAEPRAIAARGKLFVVVLPESGEQTLLALDPHTGDIIWSKRYWGSKYYTEAAYDLENDRLYAATNYDIVMFDPDDGTELGRFDFPRSGPCASAGLVVDGDFLYASICEFIVKYDLAGNIIWTFKDDLGLPVYSMTPPVVGGGLIYAGGSNWRLVALDPETGEIVWAAATVGNPTGGVLYADGIVIAGCVGFGTDYPPVLAYDAATGELLWGVLTGFGGSIYSRLSYQDGILYFGSNDQYVYAVDTRHPEILWTTMLQNDVYADIIRTGDLVYAQSSGELYALDAETGEIVWQKSFGKNIYSLLPYQGYLFVTSGMNLIGFETAQVLRGMEVDPTGIYIFPGGQRNLRVNFAASYNYPDSTIEFIFSPLPAGLSVTNLPTQPVPLDQVNLILSADQDMASFGSFPLSIQARIDGLEFSQVVQITVASTALYIPIVKR